MKNKILFLAVLVLASFIFLVPFASAAATITTSNSVSGAVTTGSSSQVITVNIQASEVVSGSVTMSCDQSTFTATYSKSSVSISASSSETITIIFEPSAAGTYENCVVRVGSDSGTVSSITAVDPSTLTATPNITAITRNASASFPFSISVLNPLGNSADVTTSYALVYDSAKISSCSGDATSSSSATIPRGTSTTKIWSCTLTSSFTSGTSNIVLQLGSVNSSTITVTGNPGPNTTVTTTTTTTGTGTGAAGTGGDSIVKASVSEEAGKATATLTSLAKDKTMRAEFTSKADLAVTQLDVSVKGDMKNVKIVAEKVASLPSDVSAPAGDVYRNLKFIPENMPAENISSIVFKFSIPKSWLTEKNISAVVMARWADNKWNELATTKETENSASVNYTASSPGFSYFSIIGKTAEQVKKEEEKKEEKTLEIGGQNITIDIDLTNSTNATVKGKKGTVLVFTLDGKTAHNITFTEVGENFTTLTIFSKQTVFNLTINETKKIELANGKKYLVAFTLKGIVNGEAEIFVEKLEKKGIDWGMIGIISAVIAVLALAGGGICLLLRKKGEEPFGYKFRPKNSFIRIPTISPEKKKKGSK